MCYQLGLIGYPVKHSLSPWIHTTFLEKTSLKGSYNIFEIEPRKFNEHILEFLDRDMVGFNVTVPFKQKIIPYLDDIDEYARNIGAVNTVVNQNGKWMGYNTDGIGYIRSLQNSYPTRFSEKDSSILLIGAGGAARGIYYALMDTGFTSIDVANKTAENGKSLLKMKNSTTKSHVLSLRECEQQIHTYDLIIQTTNVGMTPMEQEAVISLEGIKPTCVVSDIVYQPIMTTFLKHAKNNHNDILRGHSMLLYQAQHAFEIWTQKSVDIGNMEEQLLSILEGR